MNKYEKEKTIDYKFLFEEQKNISKGYKEIIEEYQNKIKEKDIRIAMLMREREYRHLNE